MRKSKISDKQFLLDCINKEFEVIGSPEHFDTFEDLVSYAEEHPKWYSENKFIIPDQYLIWKKYYEEHFYDWKPKRISKRMMREQFAWFNLEYGFALGFDYNLIKDA